MNKLKVGVITYHNTSNYGAALQAVATVSALCEQGFDAEIIDYSNKYRNGKYSVFRRVIDPLLIGNFFQAIKMLIASPGIFIRNFQFKCFYNSYLRISKASYTNPSELKSIALSYDVIVAGSDQIWSYKHNNYDYSFLLNFVPDNVTKVSYASSFGLTEIPDELKKDYKILINRIDYLSTRETTGVEIIADLTGREAFLALDPVLLHTQKFWFNMAKKINFEPGTFDLYYLNDSCHRNHPILRKSKSDKNFLRVCVGSFKVSDIFDSKFCIRNYAGPDAFLSYVMNARVVYTTSFHALVYCLIFNVQCYVFLSGDKGRDSRLLQLLDTYNLTEHAIFPTEDHDFTSIEIDFSEFNNKWPKFREESRRFLEKAVIGNK